MENFTEFFNEQNKYPVNLTESLIKMKGDAPFEAVDFKMVTIKSIRGLKLDFKLVKKDLINIGEDTLDLYIAKDHMYFILGKRFIKDNTEKFAVILDLLFKLKNNFTSKQKQLQNRDTISIETVHASKDFRRGGIATTLYKELIQNYQIMSDSVQYEGAIVLWEGLIKSKDITVWIYDIVDDKIISKATSKTHINHIWSDDTSKMRIRLIAQPK